HNGFIKLSQFGDILKSLNIEHDAKKLETIVKKSDKNHDGRIDFDEFVSVMTHFLPPQYTDEPEQVEEANDNKNRTRDINSNRQKSRERYSRCMSRHETEEMKMCFSKFDKNGDGQISEAELKEVMNDLGENLSDQEIKDMMNDADTNKDGFIDFNEFAALAPKMGEEEKTKQTK
ncbi:Calmodulin, partial [Choanephora cucurbitarum]